MHVRSRPFCDAGFCNRLVYVTAIAIVLSGCKPAAGNWATPAPTKAQIGWLQGAYSLPGAPDLESFTRCKTGMGYRRTEVDGMLPYSLIEELAVDPQGKWRLQRWEDNPPSVGSPRSLRHTSSKALSDGVVATFEHAIDKGGFNWLSPTFKPSVYIPDAGSWMVEVCSHKGYRFMIRHAGAQQDRESVLPLLFDITARAAHFERLAMKHSP